MHITSLPSPYGIGDLGKGAYNFVDFLSQSEQSYWQILPLTPTSTYTANSPYSSYSAFAGNPLLISPDLLVDEGFLDSEDLSSLQEFEDGRVSFRVVTRYKQSLLTRAFDRNHQQIAKDPRFIKFCRDNDAWLDPCAMFCALKERFGGVSWVDWPAELRDREEKALKVWRQKLADKILMEKFFQFLFFNQWTALKLYCNDRQIQIIGDVPIYVSHDSADVWLNPEVFKLDETRQPSVVAGVPPDYFSNTGQRWGNPVYDWDRLKKQDFDWWMWRIEHSLEIFDIFRLDHFRGFVAYWEIPVNEKTAVNGKWVEGPVREFFDAVLKRFPGLPMIAEDLGIITDDVRLVMADYGFPGMKILQFAFSGGPEHPYLPKNYKTNCVAYTGTHDNNTVRGWYAGDASAEEKRQVLKYLEESIPGKDMHWGMIEVLMVSAANTVIIPIQDILGLGKNARMNTPATVESNWRWRLEIDQITPEHTERLRELVRKTTRANRQVAPAFD